MAKSYAIIRGNGDILVGTGGKSGKNKIERTGWHLPGGTCDEGESPAETALREIKEETGIILHPQDEISSFQLKLNGFDVNFVVFEVVKVADEILNRKIPPIKNPYDEPFTKLECLPFKDCIDNSGFSEQHYTDWFNSGLKEAEKRNLL